MKSGTSSIPHARRGPPQAPARSPLLPLALLALTFAGLSAAPGADAIPQVASDPATLPVPSLGLTVIRLIGALVLVLGLFFGGTWLARNWQRLAPRRRTRTPDLAVLEVRSLGARQALWVVGYQRQRLLVASSPGGITLLSHLPDASAEESGPEPAPDFAEAFRSVLSRGR